MFASGRERSWLIALTLVSTLASRPVSGQAPELVVQVGHRGHIAAIAFSPDGRLLASASGDTGDDKTVRLWDARTGIEVRVLRGHIRNVTGVAFSPDGKTVVSVAADDLRFWNVADGTLLRRIEGFAYNVAFSPDGATLATIRVSPTHLCLLDSGSTAPRMCSPATRSGWERYPIAFSPDGRTVAMGASDSEGSTIELFDAATGHVVHKIQLPEITALAFSPDGAILASGTGLSAEATKLWSTATGSLLRTLTACGEGDSIAFSPDGGTLAVANGKGVTLCDPQTGSARTTLPLPENSGSLLNSGLNPVIALAFSPSGNVLAAATRWSAITLWDARSGGVLRSLGRRSGSSVEALAVSRDGRSLALATGKAISLWDMRDGRLVRELKGHGKDVTSVAFSPDGASLASGAFEPGPVKIWSVDGGPERDLRFQTPRYEEPLRSVAWSGDGRFVAGYDGKWINVWEAASGAALFKPSGVESLPRGYGVLANEAFALSPDGRWLVTASDEVYAWDVGTGRVAATVKTGKKEYYSDWTIERHSAAFSPDGTVLATATSQATTADHQIRLWQVGKEGILTPLRALKGHLDVINAVAFSPDGKRLVSGGGGFLGGSPKPGRQEDYAVRIWDVQRGALLHTLRAHRENVTGVAFSAEGRHVVSASQDRQTVVWDAQTGGQLALLLSTREGADWVAVTPEGLFDGSPAGMRDLVAWRFANNESAPLEAFFNEFYQPGLLSEIWAGRRPRAPSSLAQKDRRQPSLGIALAPGAGSVQPGAARRVTLRIEVAEVPTMAASAAGSGARDLRLFRNGSLVKVWRGDVLPSTGGKAVLEATVTVVAGENRFTAYAFNRDNIKSADATLVVTGAGSLERRGTAHVLAVGVNRYANADFDLSYAVADARAFAGEVRQQQISLPNFATVEVHPLLDHEATKANVLEALRRLGGDRGALAPDAPSTLQRIKPAEPEDAVFVYYAGHGTARGPRFYLVPHDLGYAGPRAALDAPGAAAILEHSISDLELEQAFEKVDAGRLLLVIDACNSGQALEAEEKRRGPMNSKGLAQLAYEKGMYVLAAAQGYQAALEAAQLGHGYLTYALVEEGLKSPAADVAPKDGQVVLREWLDYATTRVPQMQAARMLDARKTGRELAFVEGEEVIRDLPKRNLQRPRVFYRREPESQPLVVAKPASP